jgi:hypothetical protein
MWLPVQVMIPIEKGGVERITAFSSPDAEAAPGFTHRNDRHMAVMPETVRVELTTGFA